MFQVATRMRRNLRPGGCGGGATGELRDHRVGAEPAHRLARRVRRAADVRQQHDVLELREARREARLVLVHVEARARDRARAQRRHERGLVDDRAARGVHEHRGRLHARERGRVDQVVRLAREGAMQRDDVGALEQLLERDEARAELALPFRCWAGGAREWTRISQSKPRRSVAATR